jgi:hypothetical protein
MVEKQLNDYASKQASTDSWSGPDVILCISKDLCAGPSGRAVLGVGLRSLTRCDHGFESHRGHGCLSVVCVVCCQVEVSAMGFSLVQRSPTDCGASL